jgi:hypothetical protein
VRQIKHRNCDFGTCKCATNRVRSDFTIVRPDISQLVCWSTSCVRLHDSCDRCTIKSVAEIRLFRWQTRLRVRGRTPKCSWQHKKWLPRTQKRFRGNIGARSATDSRNILPRTQKMCLPRTLFFRLPRNFIQVCHDHSFRAKIFFRVLKVVFQDVIFRLVRCENVVNSM